MAPPLFLSQLLHFEGHAGVGGKSQVTGPPGGPASSHLRTAPLGLRLLVSLGLLRPALPLRLHVLEHGLRKAQVPRLQHAGHSVQRGHLVTGCWSGPGKEVLSSCFRDRAVACRNGAVTARPEALTTMGQLPPKLCWKVLWVSLPRPGHSPRPAMFPSSAVPAAGLTLQDSLGTTLSQTSLLLQRPTPRLQQ